MRRVCDLLKKKPWHMMHKWWAKHGGSLTSTAGQIGDLRTIANCQSAHMASLKLNRVAGFTRG
jgi:hypothetical protein